MNSVKDTIENFLVKLYLPFKVPEDNFWIVDDLEQDLENIIITYHHNVINLRITVCDVPNTNKETFYRKLLELNKNIIYGGYGIVDDKVIISHSIPYSENLSYDKFSYVYRAFTFNFVQDLKNISNIIK